MSDLDPYRYDWPREDLSRAQGWTRSEDGSLVRLLPETRDELRADSRWPAFFPSPLCLVTAADGTRTALEKVVGASIVNRFPYVLGLSFCREDLSGRHHPRRAFAETLEGGGQAAVQFLPPGPELDRVMGVIASSGESATSRRVAATALPTRPARTNPSPVFDAAYLAYEGRLVRPGRDRDGRRLFERPWIDIGSHRLYFLEITAIQLRADIATGASQIRWRSLPSWRCGPAGAPVGKPLLARLPYSKGFAGDYAFPSPDTVAFEADESVGGRAVKHLPPLPEDQVEVDNDRARWPCFFPSSVGMVTSRADGGPGNLMPCGSTTIVSRHPLVVATAVSYAAINQRYAPRASLDIIRRTRRFGCGVPYLSEQVMGAIRYAGNVSLARDPDKIANAGLTAVGEDGPPRLAELPIHYDCELVGEVPLGTHALLLGEARRIVVRADVTPENPLAWVPWATAAPAARKEKCA